MLNKLSQKFYTWARGWLVMLFLALDTVFMFFVMPMTSALMKGGTGMQEPLDLRFFSTPAQIFHLVDIYGESGRSFYRTVELTVDILYPIVYTLAFSLLLSWLFQRGFSASSPMRKLNILPVGSWLFDLLENLCIVALLTTHPAQITALAWLTTLITMIKWLFAGASMLLIVVGLVALLVNRQKE